jgi:hypothetical protein
MTTAPVKVRGGGYGLDAELARRAAEKYDYEMEDEAREWIETITGLDIGEDFGEGLRDGVILCTLVNKIHPGIVKRIESKSKLAFKLMENVSAFLKACRVMGVNEHDLFETVDLFELKDLGIVVRCLDALGRAVQRNYPQFDGPTLGVKEAIKNERQFSEEQLIKARNTPTQISYGSMRTMERQDVKRSNDVTFGADAARGIFGRAPPPPPPPSQEKIEMVSRARAAPPPPPVESEPTPSPPPSWQRLNSSNQSLSPPAGRPVKSDSVASLSKAIQNASFSEKSPSSPAKPTLSPKRSWRAQSSTPAPASPQKEAPASPPKPASPVKATPVRSGVPGLNSSRTIGDDDGAMEEAQQWIEAILNEKFLAEFGDSLKDGVILCQLMNTIKPNSVARIQTSQMPFKQMENITAFLKACRAIGVAEYDLFETVDLFELKNLGLVVKCLHALGRTVQKNVPEFTGPTLGVKESTVNKRQFSKAQLQEAAGAVPLFGQHGMSAERPHDFDRSASVTFGRDAAFSGLERKNSADNLTATTASLGPRKLSGSSSSFLRKTSNVSDSGSASGSEHPSPLVKSASKSSAMPTRTVWTK